MTLVLTNAPANSEEPETKTVRYSLDRQVRELPTRGSTVAEALAEHNIVVDGRDVVSPSLDTVVSEDMAVNVVFEKRVRVKIGKYPARDRSVAAVTVGEALDSLGVDVGPDDRVKPGPATLLADRSKIIVERVHFKKFVRFKIIHNRTVKRKSTKLYRGDSKVIKSGRDGKRRLVYERKFVNSKATWTHKVKSKTVRKAKTRVILVGTKAKPSLSGVWAALARCESGGNPRAVSSNGLYHGLFQFSVGTWNSVGGSGLPSNASIAEQVKRAKILQARSGWGQWPHCSAALGLR